jgi:aminoglycoside phosphotransferase family enzyme
MKTHGPGDRAGAPARIHETHISWITLIGDRAYKLLKPVDTGFLDHRTREARRRACRREVDENRRFAPDVYLGVLDVLDDEGHPRDHLIEMRRLPSTRRLSTLLGAEGAAGHIDAVARAIASVHARSPRSDRIDMAGGIGHLRALWPPAGSATGTATCSPTTSM